MNVLVAPRTATVAVCFLATSALSVLVPMWLAAAAASCWGTGVLILLHARAAAGGRDVDRAAS
jgi:hypothetical protein